MIMFQDGINVIAHKTWFCRGDFYDIGLIVWVLNVLQVI